MNTLGELRSYCKMRNVPCISLETEAFLRNYVQEKRPKYIGEIGSAVGYSGILMASLISMRDGQLWSVEHSFPDYQRACHNARDMHISNLTFYHGDASIIEYKKLCSQKMDLIYIDGRKSEYLTYLQRVIDIVAPHTTIIFDDVIKFAHKTSLLYDFLDKKQIKYETLHLEADDGILLIEHAGEQLLNCI